MAVSTVKRLFTTAEYHTMLQAGILTEEDRVELIEGEILQMTPIGSRHAGCIKDLNGIFSQSLGKRAVVGVQDPVHLNDFSEPQPDLSVLQPRGDKYRGSHPGPDDVFLLIEVADSSTGHDRTLKVPLYGRCGIPECWLLDLPGGLLDVHRDPTPDGYRTRHRLRAGDTVSPLAFPDLVLDVATLIA
jgi:Uma2 family endonuclease